MSVTPLNTYGYFHPRETQCKCGCGLDIQPVLRAQLNMLRKAYGAPIRVTSGARCKAYNKKVGGVQNSYHILGLAADLLWDDNPNWRHKLMRHIMIQGFTGVGVYETFVHVDLREEYHVLWID